MLHVLQVVLPVFAIIAAGFYSGRSGVLTNQDSATLNKYVFYFAMPPGVFMITANAGVPSGELIRFGYYYIGLSSISMAALYFFARSKFSLSPSAAGSLVQASILGNGIFLGLPIALMVNDWGRHLPFMLLLETGFVISVSLMIVRADEHIGIMRSLLSSIRTPVILGIIAGMGYAIAANHFGPFLPKGIERFGTLFGAAGGPTALFSLGLFLATMERPPFAKIAGQVSTILGFKLIAFPLLMLLILEFCGFTDPDIKGAAMLLCAVPPAVGSFVIASLYNNYGKTVAAALAIGTPLSLINVFLIVLLFTR